MGMIEVVNGMPHLRKFRESPGFQHSPPTLILIQSVYTIETPNHNGEISSTNSIRTLSRCSGISLTPSRYSRFEYGQQVPRMEGEYGVDSAWDC
jgi:hypothetical protein